MIASFVTAKRLALLFIAVSLATLLWRVWPDPTDDDDNVDAVPSFHWVPLSGDPLWRAAEDSDHTRCIPFLQLLIAHPNWEIQIAHGASSCTTDGLRDSFTIDGDGHVTWWRAKRPVRMLQLRPDQLAQITALDRLDCKRTEEVGYGEWWYRVSVGGDRDGRAGAHISGSSSMGKTLDKIFDEL